MRAGKTPRASIEAGYGKAFLTILDTHVTTLIAALFLFQFGTGPVKGFAVTLSIGLVFSIFTAVFVTRIIFDYFVWNKKIKAISI
jgi:preprotein translocase subunit SecD